jgi:hypothetical protein
MFASFAWGVGRDVIEQAASERAPHSAVASERLAVITERCTTQFKGGVRSDMGPTSVCRLDLLAEIDPLLFDWIRLSAKDLSRGTFSNVTAASKAKPPIEGMRHSPHQLISGRD